MYEIHTEQQGTIVFQGEILGKATSFTEHHNHSGPVVSSKRDSHGKRSSCSACRWFEVTLYLTYEDEYVVHTVGRSIVPGEIDYARHTKTESAYEVVEILTVRQRGTVFIAAPSLRALAQAASKNEDMRDAYINRAVV